MSMGFKSSSRHVVDIVNFEGNKLTKSFFSSNYIKTFGGIIDNTLENSEILGNKYYIHIYNNRLINRSRINFNSDNNIIVNDRNASIINNILDNDCTISNNTFIEEGTGISGHTKGFHDNVMTTACSINNNIMPF